MVLMDMFGANILKKRKQLSMNNTSKYFVLFLVVMSLIMAVEVTQALANDAPKLSSSLAKNLWRQAHFYFEEGMDAKAIRACTELKAWARENNNPAVEKKMNDMLAVLRDRQTGANSTEKHTCQGQTRYSDQVCPRAGMDR